MLANFWHWLVFSDRGLLVRVAVGVSILAAMAVRDLVRRGREAQRWREYTYLAAAAGLAMLFGAGCDLVTSSISWEYFYYGKGFFETLGPYTPPPAADLAREAVLLGARASWSGGLLLGVAVLIANNPRRGRPRLPYRTLYRLMPLPMLSAVGVAAIGGLVVLTGLFDGILGADVLRMVDQPRRFACVWGAHAGAYVGGLTGVVGVVVVILRRRRAAGLSRLRGGPS